MFMIAASTILKLNLSIRFNNYNGLINCSTIYTSRIISNEVWSGIGDSDYIEYNKVNCFFFILKQINSK